MFPATLICLLAAIGQTQSPLDRGAQPPGAAALPRYHELDREIRQTLQGEARAATVTERTAAVHGMLGLFATIQHDPRLAESPTLNQYRLRLAARLRRIAEEIRKTGRTVEKRSEPVRDARVAESPPRPTPEAAASPRPTPAPRQGFGRPAPAGGTAGGLPDWGFELAALIERTIAPKFWDTQGGPGTVFYYRPQRALVVRATTEVHEDIAELLGDLRAAGP